MKQLEAALLAVARAITNLVSTTHGEVVRKEADLPPLAQRLRELTLLHADNGYNFIRTILDIRLSPGT